ncbi:uncharacterized protein LOC143204568 isoform X2 [Rhynchophorus ferrugineus]|uniref:uncharacterized protein LOC143204568 isoform X2 n=1 Tax=Rhynchophorus ferrugineus TaxID=354439 RepID=UPI003FCD3423
MENDKSADNEKELTSTSSCGMGKLLSTNKEEKSDSNDTLPTSSTDASTSFTATNLVPDDPISSTSSETDPIKTKQLIAEPEKQNFPELEEVELLEMSMATASEKIEENVDDLVNDLETLLGESSQPFSLHNASSKPDISNKDMSEIENVNTPEGLPDDEVSSNTVNVEKETTETTENSQDHEMSSNTKTNVIESENISGEILQPESNKFVEEVIETKDINLSQETMDDKCHSHEENILTSDVDHTNIEQNLNDKPHCDVKDNLECDELSSNKNTVTSITPLLEPTSDTDKHIKAAVSNIQESNMAVDQNVQDNFIKNSNMEPNKDEGSEVEKEHSDSLNTDTCNMKICENSLKDNEHSESKGEISSNINIEECTKRQCDDITLPEIMDISNQEKVCENKMTNQDIALNEVTDNSNIQKTAEEEIPSGINENVKTLTADIQECDKVLEKITCKEDSSETDMKVSAIIVGDVILKHDQVDDNVDIHKSTIDSLEININQVELKLNEQLQSSTQHEEQVSIEQETITVDTDQKIQNPENKEEEQAALETKTVDVSDNLPEQSEGSGEVIEKVEDSISGDINEITVNRESSRNVLFNEESDSEKLLCNQSNTLDEVQEKETIVEEIFVQAPSPHIVSGEASLVVENIEENMGKEPLEKKDLELMDTSECPDDLSAHFKPDVSAENLNKDTDDVTDQYTFNIEEENSQDNKLETEENVNEVHSQKNIEVAESATTELDSDSCVSRGENNAIESQKELNSVSAEVKEAQLTLSASLEREKVCEQIIEQPLEHETQLENSSNSIEVSMLEEPIKVDTTEPSVTEVDAETMECARNVKEDQAGSFSEDVQFSILESAMEVDENCSEITDQDKSSENTDNVPETIKNVTAVNENETVNEESQVSETIIVDSNIEKEDIELSTTVEQNVDIVLKEETDELKSSIDQKPHNLNDQVLDVGESQDVSDNNDIAKDVESNISVQLLKSNIEKEETEIETGEFVSEDTTANEDETTSMDKIEEVLEIQEIVEHNVDVEITADKATETVEDEDFIKDEAPDNSKEASADNEVELAEPNSNENVIKCINEDQIEDTIKEKLADDTNEEIGGNVGKEEIKENSIEGEINDNIKAESPVVKSTNSEPEMEMNEEYMTPEKTQSDTTSPVIIEDQMVLKENANANVEGIDSEQTCHLTEKISSTDNVSTMEIEEIQKDSDEVDNTNVCVNKSPIRQDDLIALSETSTSDKKTHMEINIRRKTVEQDLEKVVCLSEESSDSDSVEMLKCTSQDTKGSVNSDGVSSVSILNDQIVTSMPLSDDQVSTSVTPSEEQLTHEMEEENSNLEETDLIKIAKQVEHRGDDSSNALSETTEDSHELLSKNQEADKSPFSLRIVQSANTKSNIDDRNLTDKELRDIEAIRAAVASITDSSQDTYDSYLVDSSVTENILPEISDDVPELSGDPVDVQETCSNSPKSVLIEDIVQGSTSTDIIQERKEATQTENLADLSVQKTAETSNLEKIPAEDASTSDVKNTDEGNVERPNEEPENVFESSNKEDETVEEKGIVKEEPLGITKENSISENDVLKKADVTEEDITVKQHTTKMDNSDASALEDKLENMEEMVMNEKMGKNKSRKSMKINEPLSISIEDVEREKLYSPKVTIKPVKVPDDEVSTTSDAEVKGSLKMTITKQSDTMHSILKVFNPEDDSELGDNEEPIPKLIIKPKHEQQHSPKTPSRSSKIYSPTSTQRCGSPRVTIKPVVKPPESKNEPVGPLKITFKPVVKADDATKRHSPKARELEQKNHNPKITIKPIPKPVEPEKEEGMPTTPKVTIKPIKRPHEDMEGDMEHEKSSPKITIKPVVRSSEDIDQPNQSTPRLIIKPIKKQEEEMKEHEQGRSSPKISIKPIVKPASLDNEEEIEEVKERIVLKINKGNLPTPGKDKSKREYPEDEKSEKLGKIKLKFSTSGGHPHIVQEDEGVKKQKKDYIFSQNPESQLKRALDDKMTDKSKKMRTSITPEREVKVELQTNEQKINPVVVNIDDLRANALVGDKNCLTPSSIKIMDLVPRSLHAVAAAPALTITATTPVTPTPKKRGRPRKVPLEIRPELTDPINPQATYHSTPSNQSITSTPGSATSSAGRPKRSCRGQNVIATLGIKPRKPRGRGRGSKVNMGDRLPVMVSPIGPIQTVSMKPEKDSKLNKAKFKLMHKTIEEEVKRQQDQIRIIGQEAEGLEGTDTVAITKTNFLVRPHVGDNLADNVTLTKRTNVHIDQNDTIIILTDDEDDKSNVQDDEVCYERNPDRKLSDEYKLAEGIEMTESRELEEATEDDDDAGDSEEDRRRQLVKQRKQEAIKKCRAKRMEKLAKAAELKKKRQEQAKLQREARMAAEEAERQAAEKARINRRYGRYGTPKPQISLIDEPVRESGGTVKSPRGLFDPGTEMVKVSQPCIIVVDEDSNQQVLKADSSNNSMPSTSTNPQKYAGESMQVDIEDSSMADQSMGADDLVMMDEETRMSADFRGSRSHTPAKHSIAPVETIVEDSQGSLGTTESGKSKNAKAPRLEVHQESDSHTFTADQLAEYFWNGQGPFMLQEQVAHFLGIKSFKRKYPHVSRRSVEIQERDFLKEQGLASETMCDLGLTAVNAQDILDIMYSDFQDKYEEYCRVQREKQARDFANKQKATQQALKSGYERLDIIEQAVQSAAQWNKQFNKERKDQRKASMDLQNLVIHYPKSKIKPVQTRRIGNYPVALVPGQFTDFYKEFTPTELNNLPLNTMCYDEIKIPVPESESDFSDSSDSDSESSSTSSSSDSECGTDCKECNTHDAASGRGGKNITATKESNTTVGTPA